MQAVSDGTLQRVVVVGLGLMGGSIAAASRARRVAARVVGVTRSDDTATRALRRGLVDEALTDPCQGVRGADLVVLATPISAMATLLGRAAPQLAAGTVVTDVGSVKGCLAETLPGLLPEGVHYVGAHPMAGSHETGLRHARAELLEGAACVVTPAPNAPLEAVSRVRDFFAALGARVALRSPAEHDREVAWVSHVPHALAFAFARSLASAPTSAAALRGSGFADFTRIAASDPQLWADILVTNRKALAGPLHAQAQALATLARCLDAGDAEAVQRTLAEAREALAHFAPRSFRSGPTRSAAEDAPPGGGNPENEAATVAATKE